MNRAAGSSPAPRLGTRATACSAAALLAAVAVGGATSSYAHPADPEGHTTVEQTLAGDDPEQGFQTLRAGPGERYVVRDDLGTKAKRGRGKRRASLIYVGQITDFQLADEESPAREERTDSEPFRRALGSSGYRPQEALVVHAVELTVRQMNNFIRSPIAQGDGSHARMANAVMTGDLADNMQRNETEWVMRLLEGGRLDPNSGTDEFSGTFCAGMPADALDDPRNYTGVQDYDDYLNDNPLYYDPEHPIGAYADWPTYPGLLDRAQRPFRAEGLKVPTYVAFGNHDGLYQGTVGAFPPLFTPGANFEDTAINCLKPVYPITDEDAIGAQLTPDHLAQVLASDPDKVMLVPPDANRQFVDRSQFKSIFDPAIPRSAATQADAHGFAFVDRKETRDSTGAAAYYSFSPKRGIRYIVLDTVANAGTLGAPALPGSDSPFAAGSEGNIDNPQWLWLEDELKRAQRRDELIIVFAHHNVKTLTFGAPDELAPCGTLGIDEHGHDALNPSCDLDPRPSTPLHGGAELADVLHKHPNAIALVAGHTHENEITPFPDEDGKGGFWQITSPAIADWPPQHRLIEVMDNRDETLSIFATLLDYQGPLAIPDSGTEDFGLPTLGSIARTLTYNDPQAGPDLEAIGTRADHNAELLVRDPREPPEVIVEPVTCGLFLAVPTKRGTPGDDRGRRALIGTRRRDVIEGRGGNDEIRGRRGRDRLCGNGGNDFVAGGRGADVVRGDRGRDVVRGGRGPDRVQGGPGRDRLSGGPGDDICIGGRGRDVADRSCERVRQARRP